MLAKIAASRCNVQAPTLVYYVLHIQWLLLPVQMKLHTEMIYMQYDPLPVQQFIMAAIKHKVEERAETRLILADWCGPQLGPDTVHHKFQVQQLSQNGHVCLMGPAPLSLPVC